MRKSANLQSFFYKSFFALVHFCVCAVILISPLFAQRLAVLVPEENPTVKIFAEELETSLSAKFKILDNSLSAAAFRSVEVENVFNLNNIEAKNIGAVIGCDYFLLVKAATQRRAAISKNDYYESFAFIYVVSSRTGRLVDWRLKSFEAENQSKAEKTLLETVDQSAIEISEKLKATEKAEINEKSPPKIEEVPAEVSPNTKNFRPPLPFKRIKPEYTRLAYLYGVAATIDIEIDLDENGSILRAEIVRWAGFGLDESVSEAVRKMNWRAAERNDKTLPMRILLRYNFKKLGED